MSHRPLQSVGVYVATLAMLLAWTAQPAVAQGKEPVKVGVLLTLTTPLAFYGTPQLEAIRMATEAANAEGGVHGRPIELVVEDSDGSNTVAINGLNRILQSRPAAVVGPVLGTQNMALLPLVNKAQVPLLVAASTRRLTQQGSAYLFRFAAHDAVGKETWTRFVVETLGKKRVGIIYVSDEWGHSGRDWTSQFLEKLYSLKPASLASFQGTDKDMTGQLVQMQRDGVDIILTQGHPAHETLISKQIRQLGIQLPRIGSASLCVAFARDVVDPKDVEGMYCDAAELPPMFHTKPAIREWALAFKKRMGADKPGSEPDVTSLQYYDAMRTLVAVMRQYGTQPEDVRKGLREIRFDGLLSTYRADREGNMYHQSTIIRLGPGRTAHLVRRVTVEPEP